MSGHTSKSHGDKGHNDALDTEDAALWACVTAQTRPLTKKMPKTKTKPQIKFSNEKKSAIEPLPIYLPPVEVPLLPSLAPMAPSARERLPRGDERDLKRGAVRIDGRIDLHGLTREEAHRAVRRYLSEAVDDERRIVLIITGKGGRNDSGGGVLRGELPRWLHEGALSRIVLAWRPAAPRHGGDGAFYVLLRKKARRS